MTPVPPSVDELEAAVNEAFATLDVLAEYARLGIEKPPDHVFRFFQRLHGLPETGAPDTLDHREALAVLAGRARGYEEAVNDYEQAQEEAERFYKQSEEAIALGETATVGWKCETDARIAAEARARGYEEALERLTTMRAFTGIAVDLRFADSDILKRELSARQSFATDALLIGRSKAARGVSG